MIVHLIESIYTWGRLTDQNIALKRYNFVIMHVLIECGIYKYNFFKFI